LSRTASTQALHLQYILEQHDYRTSIASNGKEALALARQHKPFMSITDVLMPEMDGYRLCQQIKADPNLHDIPVLLLTSLSDAKDILKGLECSADHFIIKPYDDTYLLSRLRSILTNRALRKHEKAVSGEKIIFADQEYQITADRWQILDLLLSTYETAVQKNRELMEARDALQRLKVLLEEKVAERTVALQAEIEERTRAGEVSQENQTRLRAIMDHVADGILTIDERGIIEAYNPAAERIFGYTPAEIGGQNVRMLVFDRGPCEDDNPLSTDVPTGRSEPFASERELVGRRKDGSTFSLELALSEMHLGDRRMFTIVARDITQRKEVQRLKDELVATVSHEVRTPLSSLRGFAELMLTRDFPPEKQQEFLTIILKESVRLKQLIDTLLDIQRMESGRQAYNFERIELVSLVRDTVALFAEGDVKHPWHLELPDTLPAVRADPDRLRQVLLNLFSNAVKFSPHGGTVTVSAHQQGAHIEVRIADQGVGIPPDALPKLFSKFFRVHNHETRHITGTGLGLALVKQIIEDHAGRVGVESSLGQGSTFFLTLPADDQTFQAVSAHPDEESP
jgi:PAS domain S-box-containing protein